MRWSGELVEFLPRLAEEGGRRIGKMMLGGPGVM